MHPDFFKISFEVQTALDDEMPVVALESTVITHGLPWPQNVETAAEMEAAVRKGGAIPATIALINGEVRIGLSQDELTFLAQQPAGSVLKCSRRDLPTVIMHRGHGSTTVAATMILAQLAGIQFFATGGIGGVHRGQQFDVSADLYELGKTPVTVICSGAKAILDIPNTLEVLETQGVAVVGFGCDKLPLFYSRESVYDVNVRLDSPDDVAQLVLARNALGLETGTLVTVPVPAADEVPSKEIQETIETALFEADEAGIKGAETTPWLLSRIATLSGNRSMSANIALLINNGFVAGQIALAHKKMVN
ncbi:MAG: pseudouridine-5'-phosphate glycosidase [Chloroflexota bacterium]